MLFRRTDPIGKLVGKILIDRIVISHRRKNFAGKNIKCCSDCDNNCCSKYFFILKYIKIIFFYILNFIFDLNTSNNLKKIKKNNFFKKHF